MQPELVCAVVYVRGKASAFALMFLFMRLEFALFPRLLAVERRVWLSNRIQFQVVALLTPERGPWVGLVVRTNLFNTPEQ